MKIFSKLYKLYCFSIVVFTFGKVSLIRRSLSQNDNICFLYTMYYHDIGDFVSWRYDARGEQCVFSNVGRLFILA